MRFRCHRWNLIWLKNKIYIRTLERAMIVRRPLWTKINTVKIIRLLGHSSNLPDDVDNKTPVYALALLICEVGGHLA